MDEFKVIEIKRSVFENNDREADRLRAELKKEKTFLLNLMSSPGSGKTTTLKATIARLKDELKIGVMEADIDSDVDARTIADTGVKSIQLHTGGMCHLDAGMTEQGLKEFGTEDLDLVVLENVGNLVCPAEFDCGEDAIVAVLGVTEGDDKPEKYPLLFHRAGVLILNKIDLLPYVNFSIEKATQHARKLNEPLEIISLSCRTGEGLQVWYDWLRDSLRKKRSIISNKTES